MKSKEMLKAIGNIDDQFVTDAETKSDNKEIKTKKSGFLKWAGAVAAVLAVCVIGGAAINAMRLAGSSYKYKYADASMEQEAYSYANSGQTVKEGIVSDSKNDDSKLVFDSESINLLNSKTLANKNVKLIYTADISMQTTDYDETLNSLKTLVNQFEGYFEGSDVYNGGLYSAGGKSGYYTIRIPAERYASFINTMGDTAYVVSLQESVEDIGEQYYEVEGRINTLKIKEERLQALLKEAKDLSDIITLENELSDVEYQLEQYGTQLNHYDSLVGYSTVNVQLEEVSAYKDSPLQKEDFGTRFVRALKVGVSNTADNLIDFAIWIGYNLIEIIICAVVIFLIWKFHLIKRLIKKITGK